jgi:hypothetical protein
MNGTEWKFYLFSGIDKKEVLPILKFVFFLTKIGKTKPASLGSRCYVRLDVL